MLRKVNWLTVLFSGLGTALLIFGGNFVYEQITSKAADLIYTIAPQSSFRSEDKTVTIHSGSFRNAGSKVANSVVAVIALPQGVILSDKNIVPTNRTLKFTVSQPEAHLLEISLPSGLNPKEGISFSLLTEGPTNQPIAVDLRGTGVQGRAGGAQKTGDDRAREPTTFTFMLPIMTMLMVMVMMMVIFQTRERLVSDRGSQRRTALGGAYEEIGRLDDALTQYRKAVDLEPDEASAHASLGKLLARQDKYEEALVECQLAIQLAPKEWYPYYCKAITLARQKDMEKTTEVLKQALACGKSRKLRDFIRTCDDLEEFRNTKHYEQIKEILD